MTRRSTTRPVTSAEIRSFLERAEACSVAAAEELEVGRMAASVQLSFYAVLNAADAVCGARLGERAGADSIDQVVVLLDRIGIGVDVISSSLPALGRTKLIADHHPEVINAAIAHGALGQAQRSIDDARRLIIH